MAGTSSPNAPNISHEQLEIAHTLLQVAPSPDFLRLKEEHHKSKYIPLENLVGKSKVNKNAVSVHKNFVSFMVPDWTVCSQATLIGLLTEQNTKLGKRILFIGLSQEKIRSNVDFFRNLLVVAKKESSDRQTYGRKPR